MTKNDLIRMLSEATGNPDVCIWDPNSEAWEPVTGMTHGDGGPIWLYSDGEGEEEDAP